MPAAVRAIARAESIARRQLREIGEELRERRLGLNLSQAWVASAARMSRNHYGPIERGVPRSLSVEELNRVAAVLGFDASVRLYPGGVPIRDLAQSARLRALLDHVRPPLRWATEVPLPANDRREQRAWDAVLRGGGERTAIEFETRLRDVQALERRIALKRRDDPTEGFLLVVARTRHNRRVLHDVGGSIGGLELQGQASVLTALEVGRHPPVGLVMLGPAKGSSST